MKVAQFLWNQIPDFNTIYGFFFYSTITYGALLFFSWLAAPTLDEACREEIEKRKLREKGDRMRKIYKE